MEILLTLESVVVNLAECLKNSDLMAALTRYTLKRLPFYCGFNTASCITTILFSVKYTGRPHQIL